MNQSSKKEILIIIGVTIVGFGLLLGARFVTNQYLFASLIALYIFFTVGLEVRLLDKRYNHQIAKIFEQISSNRPHSETVSSLLTTAVLQEFLSQLFLIMGWIAIIAFKSNLITGIASLLVGRYLNSLSQKTLTKTAAALESGER